MTVLLFLGYVENSSIRAVSLLFDLSKYSLHSDNSVSCQHFFLTKRTQNNVECSPNTGFKVVSRTTQIDAVVVFFFFLKAALCTFCLTDQVLMRVDERCRVQGRELELCSTDLLDGLCYCSVCTSVHEDEDDWHRCTILKSKTGLLHQAGDDGHSGLSLIHF